MACGSGVACVVAYVGYGSAQKKYPGASLRLRNTGGANNRVVSELCHSAKSDFTFYHIIYTFIVLYLCVVAVQDPP